MSKSDWNWAIAPCWFKLTIFCITAITTVKLTWGGFACLENPCMHGICIDYLDVNSSSMCYCLNGYTGFHCQINWDECFHLNPCLNGGSCSDGIASFNCSCPDNFAGALCQYDLSACEEICHNNASCTIDSNSGNETVSCHCPPGFVGSQCEVDISICNTTENACLNGGQCQDGVGESFLCKCEPGWEGDVCQQQIDNCKSQPCQSGGICVNKLNDFACACPFGYTGKVCEKKLKICEINPCENGAFCLHEDEDETKKTCYCVPDYGGDLCEFKYDDCSPAPRCSNGGTCIDGVGAFSCSCPPDFFGPTCQCTAENITEPACQLNETTTIHATSQIWPYPASTTFFSDKISTKLPRDSDLMTGIPPETIISSLPPTPHSVTIEGRDSSTIIIFESESIIVPTQSEPTFPSESIMSMDSAKPYPVTSTATFPLDSSTQIIEIEPSISLEGSEGSVSISHSSLMSLFPTPISTWPSASLSENETTQSVWKGDSMSTWVAPSLSSSSPNLITPGDLHSASDYWVTSSSFKLPEVEHNSSIPTPNPSSKLDSEIGGTVSGRFTTILPLPTSVPISLNPNMTQTVLFTATMSPTTDLMSTDVVIEPTISYEFSTVELESAYSLSTKLPVNSNFPVTTELLSPIITTLQIPPDYSSATLVTSTLSISQTLSPSISPSPTVSDSRFLTTMIDGDTSPSVPFPPEPSDTLVIIETSGVGGVTTIFVPQLSLTSMTSLLTTITTIPQPTPSSSFHFTTPEPSLTPSSPGPSLTTSSSQTDDPCLNFCSNDGNCISDSIQPTCICPFKFLGERCEIPRKRFKTVSFTGDSFLEYKVPNDSNKRIGVKTRLATNNPDAILAHLGNSRGRLYALVFIQAGRVCLHFSCGLQSMHFVETRTRVDNGHNFTLEFSMEMVDHAAANETDEVHNCIGELRVNHSYIMRGEQIVGRNGLYENPIQFISLGGVDTSKANRNKNDDLIGIMPGFRGCSYSLEINGESMDLFDDAIHGQEVDSCSAFGCVTNPCFGGAKCVPWNKFPFWQCICSTGFEGDRCQVRVCDSNPCQNGATCTRLPEEIHTEILNTTEISAHPPQPQCLCKLGFSGNQCQSSINITKPSFKPFSGFDYSGYIAYEPIPRFADWVQLKLHFVNKNYSQIALLLYSGYTHSLTAPSVSNPDDLDALAELLKEGASIREEDLATTNNNNNEVGTGNQKVSDFFAVTYVAGYVALTWNLGSGTQRIITPGRIDKRINVHTLYAGRSGRKAWIKVDGMRNITGKSPGPFHRLNVNSELFLGGYEAFRFEGLPHDLPMHMGFTGCIFDFGFRVKQRLYLPKPLRGRNVKNCYEEDC